ncbi:MULTISPECIES: hypothetical protein [unclassified Streptomyces]|uniref:hypothetical protein n=1 Tax=unclassified Streptomyces TaxID=2593676 RepID=UPI002E2D1BE8|nr:hypothetical protein [Streptomyces sp. NBC_00273]
MLTSRCACGLDNRAQLWPERHLVDPIAPQELPDDRLLIALVEHQEHQAHRMRIVGAETCMEITAP